MIILCLFRRQYTKYFFFSQSFIISFRLIMTCTLTFRLVINVYYKLYYTILYYKLINSYFSYLPFFFQSTKLVTLKYALAARRYSQHVEVLSLMYDCLFSSWRQIPLRTPDQAVLRWFTSFHCLLILGIKRNILNKTSDYNPRLFIVNQY